MMNFAGFEPGIIGIIIYLIFSAVMAKKKKERKLRSRGAPKSPPPSKEDVFSLLNSLKSELRKSFEPKPDLEFPPKKSVSDDFETTEEYTQKEDSGTAYETFEREKRLEETAEQKEMYSDVVPFDTDAAEIKSRKFNKLNPSLKAVANMSLLKQGIVWKEILEEPIALRRDTPKF